MKQEIDGIAPGHTALVIRHSDQTGTLPPDSGHRYFSFTGENKSGLFLPRVTSKHVSSNRGIQYCGNLKYSTIQQANFSCVHHVWGNEAVLEDTYSAVNETTGLMPLPCLSNIKLQPVSLA